MMRTEAEVAEAIAEVQKSLVTMAMLSVAPSSARDGRLKDVGCIAIAALDTLKWVSGDETSDFAQLMRSIRAEFR